MQCGAARRAAARAPVRAAAKKEKMMWETLREAIDEEMEADPTVLVMGAHATPAESACGCVRMLNSLLLRLNHRTLQAFVMCYREARPVIDAVSSQCWLASDLHARWHGCACTLT